jgi:hypothetical protein
MGNKEFLQAVIDRLPNDLSAELGDCTGGCFATVYYEDDEGSQPCANLVEHDGDMTVGWYDQEELIFHSDDPDVVAMYVMLLVERTVSMTDSEYRAFIRKYAPDS